LFKALIQIEAKYSPPRSVMRMLQTLTHTHKSLLLIVKVKNRYNDWTGCRRM